MRKESSLEFGGLMLEVFIVYPCFVELINVGRNWALWGSSELVGVEVGLSTNTSATGRAHHSRALVG